MLPPARLAIAALVVACCTAGCTGQPQVSHENRRLVESLATAVSAREPKWLEQNVKLIDERRAAGRLSEPEARAFQSIVAKANAGDWDLAESLAFALRDAQRGSSEEASVDPRPKLRSPRGRVTSGRQH